MIASSTAWLAEAPDRALGPSDLAVRCQQSLSVISHSSGAEKPGGWCVWIWTPVQGRFVARRYARLLELADQPVLMDRTESQDRGASHAECRPYSTRAVTSCVPHPS